MNQGPLDYWINILDDENQNNRIEAARMLATLSINPQHFDLYLQTIGDQFVKDINEEVRYYLIYVFSNLVEGGQNLTPVLAQLIQGLHDSAQSIRKQTLWILFCMARMGKDITKAVPVLEKAYTGELEQLGRNALIGLGIHYMRNRENENFFNFLEKPNLKVDSRFAAAYSSIIWGLRKEDWSFFQKTLSYIKTSLEDQDIVKGIAKALLQERKQGIPLQPALDQIHQAIQQEQEDIIRQMALQGIFMHMG